ncbi:trem-like transcript 2 protein isoform X2 [Oryctolagus cuniculus]|uniref:trem-like transcript 2 protein isoform X2 n=1 Tax=Oryctolagus cuniculus TaxID=9986 RepID=UPI0038791AFA
MAPVVLLLLLLLWPQGCISASTTERSMPLTHLANVPKSGAVIATDQASTSGTGAGTPLSTGVMVFTSGVLTVGRLSSSSASQTTRPSSPNTSITTVGPWRATGSRAVTAAPSTAQATPASPAPMSTKPGLLGTSSPTTGMCQNKLPSLSCVPRTEVLLSLPGSDPAWGWGDLGPHLLPSASTPQAPGYSYHSARGGASPLPGAHDVDRGLWVLEEETHRKLQLVPRPCQALEGPAQKPRAPAEAGLVWDHVTEQWQRIPEGPQEAGGGVESRAWPGPGWRNSARAGHAQAHSCHHIPVPSVFLGCRECAERPVAGTTRQVWRGTSQSLLRATGPWTEGIRALGMLLTHREPRPACLRSLVLPDAGAEPTGDSESCPLPTWDPSALNFPLLPSSPASPPHTWEGRGRGS